MGRDPALCHTQSALRLDHLELKRYFGIDQLLSEKTAKTIFAACNEQLKDKSFSVRSLLKKMYVSVLCTTDDPVDDLAYHLRLKNEILT